MGRSGFRGLLIGLLVVAALAAAGMYGYNIGLARGLTSGAAVAAPAAGVPVMYMWRPWGFGFGFFPFFPLFFIVLLLFAFRGGRRWGYRGYYGYGPGCGSGYGYRGGVPPAFDEWHRRAHAQDRPEAPAEPTRL